MEDGSGERSSSRSWRNARYRRFFEVVDEVVAELQELPDEEGKRGRRLGGDHLEKLKHSVERLIRDSVAVVLQRKRKGEAAIHLRSQYYGRGCPDPQLTYKIHVERAYRGMLRLGYLEEVRKGYFDRTPGRSGRSRSRLTRYVATDKLIDRLVEDDVRLLPVIVPPPTVELVQVKVKDEDGIRHRLPVERTPEVEEMTANLERINRVLLDSWYDLELPDGEIISLQEKMQEGEEKGDEERILDLSRRTLYRVFNDPELKTGGRLYGGWWQNIKNREVAYRSKLIVNGKRMSEFDYSNMHPTILYTWEGIPAPKDSYSGVLNRIKPVDASQEEELRDEIKKAFNAMLNAEKRLDRPPRGIKLKRFGLKWKDLSQAIRDYHAPIAHRFETGIGTRLQRLDSDIAEKVLLHFAKHGIPVLPVHDSFLAHHGYSELPDVMARAFKEVIGCSPNVKLEDTKDGSGWRTDASAEPDEDDNMDKLFDQMIEFLKTGHETRLRTFQNTQSRSRE